MRYVEIMTIKKVLTWYVIIVIFGGTNFDSQNYES